MRARTIYVIGSIVLHLLLFLLFAVWIEFDLFAREDPASALPSNPIVFELEPEPKPQELVETPDDAAVNEFQKNTNLFSDKNALARNPEIRPDLKVGEAFSEGDFDIRELPRNNAPVGSPGELAENKLQEAEDKLDEQEIREEIPQAQSKFSRQALTKQTTTSPGESDRSANLSFDNQDSQALDLGGFTFNTYDWDFAPYMLAMKERVEGNIFPPAAYYRMGIIAGVSKIRFRIYPDGQMTHLQVLDYKGHKTLMETSVRSLEISAPFPPLPPDFPEPYLEVTGIFPYPNLKLLRYRKG